jgi:uncharacterized membrane protein/thiol-disulfide isomerase/thioredoxin
MRTLFLFSMALLVATTLLLPASTMAQADTDQPVVRAVLFFSPTCPHCHLVIKELLLPMVEEYGDQLLIIGIDITQPDGSSLYQTAIEHYQIPPERRGVPTLIVKDIVLVGSGEIPDKFPGLVEEGLANGGIPWPDIPGFEPELNLETQEEPADNNQPAAPTASSAGTETTPPTTPTKDASEATPTAEAELALAPAPTDPPPPTPDQSIVAISENTAPATTAAEAPPADPIGTALAGVILIGMVIALMYALWRVTIGAPSLSLNGQVSFSPATSWAIPLLSLLGLGVSIYLAYVEINHVEAVCGPVGHCNIVQSSPYAQIVGIPVAVLGLLNFVAIIVLWAIQKYSDGPLANLSTLALVGLTIFGTGFSIYLTMLEIFVIQAICAWCLSSAVITTVLMLLCVMPVTAKSRLQRVYSH